MCLTFDTCVCLYLHTKSLLPHTTHAQPDSSIRTLTLVFPVMSNYDIKNEKIIMLDLIINAKVSKG